ncbi:hypothetical protein D3C85_1413480 [compost metagenome]
MARTGYFLLRLLTHFLQASAKALSFCIEFDFIGSPVHHVGGVVRHERVAVGKVLTAVNLRVQPVEFHIQRVNLSFSLVVLVAHFTFPALLNRFGVFQRHFIGNQGGSKALHLTGQLVAAVFHFLNFVHLIGLYLIR